MPRVTRLMIRLALCYLITGITIGSLMLLHKALGIDPLVWILLPVHIETLFWGFIIQFTLGMAYWILPRYLSGPGRGNRFLPWIMVLLLNTGILLNVFTLLPVVNEAFPAAGRIVQLCAVGLFIFMHWNRITTYRNR